MTVETKLSGRCHCGHVTWEADGPPVWSAICHCEDCRRAASAPMVGWLGVKTADVVWSGPLRRYQSSALAERGFCNDCGAPLLFENPTRWPGETYLYAPTLHDPAEFHPECHLFINEKLPWIKISDGLPQFNAPDRIADET